MMTTLLAMALLTVTAPPTDRPRVLVVVGAPGTEDYGTEFQRWAALWRAAAEKGSAAYQEIGRETETEAAPTDHDRVRDALQAASANGVAPLWIVLIGHGTFDGREAKFNLRGPDVTDAELLEWLKPVTAPVAILNCFSASGSFLNRLSASNRVVVTATRSGDEQNLSHFGRYLAESIADPRADLDKDGQVSLLEAFLVASSRLAEFYRAGARLATEHPLLDDNGDRLGTPGDWFRGIHATKRAKDGAQPDGVRAHQWHLILSDREQRMPAEQRKRRDQLEQAAAALRARKSQLPEDAYYAQLEAIMVELARLYQNATSP